MIYDLIPFVSAQVEAPSASTIGNSAFALGYQLLFGLVAIVILAALFFGTRVTVGWWKKRKNYKVTASIYNPDGTFYVKKIGKFRTKDGIDKMLFQGSSETMPVIEPKFIRAARVTLFRYAPGQYAVIPPKIWENTDPKKWKIELINMQMKNFAFLEQRAAVSRWAYVKDLLNRWGPYMTLMIVAITAGVISWFLMKLGYNIFNDAVQARITECSRLVGKAVPTGV